MLLNEKQAIKYLKSEFTQLSGPLENDDQLERQGKEKD